MDRLAYLMATIFFTAVVLTLSNTTDRRSDSTLLELLPLTTLEQPVPAHTYSLRLTQLIMMRRAAPSLSIMVPTLVTSETMTILPTTISTLDQAEPRRAFNSDIRRKETIVVERSS